MQESPAPDWDSAPDSYTSGGTPISGDARSSLAKRLGLFGGIASLALSLIATFVFVSSPGNSSSLSDLLSSSSTSTFNSDNSTTVPDDTSWVLDGFTV